jgi:hypothetical protein
MGPGYGPGHGGPGGRGKSIGNAHFSEVIKHLCIIC